MGSTGRMMREIAAEPVVDGNGIVTFETEDASGVDLAPGCYFITVSAGRSLDSRSLALIR